MALEKQLETEQGIKINYWCIGGMPIFNRVKKLATIVLHGYLDKQSKLDGKEPVREFHYNIDNETIEPIQIKRQLTLEERRGLGAFTEYTEEKIQQWRKEQLELNPKLDEETLDKLQEDMLAEHEKIFIKISDKKLMEMDLPAIEVKLDNKAKYFDEFEKVFDKDGWQAASYNFLKTNKQLKEIFADAKDI